MPETGLIRGFHSNWTRPFFVRSPEAPYAVEPFELLTTALSALAWRQENGPIYMLCDSVAKQYYESLGVSFLWDGGVYPLLDAIPPTVNAMAFWAAGKLYALAAMRAPCVMIDTDFIVWKPLEPLLRSVAIAAIHTEEIAPSIYPGPESLQQARGFPFASFDWSALPLNTALLYLRDDTFRRYYTDTALQFIRSAPQADDVLTYMVFAEQRLLAMCAAKKQIPVQELQPLSALFNGEQEGYFTHVWGFKQQMRDEPRLYDDFCRRCAARLVRTFPAAADQLATVSTLAPYFS